MTLKFGLGVIRMNAQIVKSSCHKIKIKIIKAASNYDIYIFFLFNWFSEYIGIELRNFN